MGCKFPVPDTSGIGSLPVDKLVPNRLARIKAHECMGCDDKVEGFDDDLSQKEYLISGLCQKCQDLAFVEE